MSLKTAIHVQGHIRMRGVAAMCLALLVTACASTGDENVNLTAASTLAVQPFPTNYRADLLAFMKTYLNDPRGVRNAIISEPVQRAVSGKPRYVACVRYTATEKGDGINGSGDRAVIYLDGRLERLIEKPRELCADAVYASFPEMEKLSR